jgi:YtkA-like
MVVCVALLIAAGCRGNSASAASMPIRTQIAPQPVRVGDATVTITGIVDGLGEPLAGVHIQVEGDMAHPGMAPMFGDAKETAPGTYQAQLEFNMPGDWVLLEHIRLADGTKIERQLDVRGVIAQ